MLWTLVNKYLLKTLLSFLLDIYSELELLGHMVILYLTFCNFHNVFHSACTILHSYQWCTKVPISPNPCQHLFPGFLIVAILMGMRWCLIVALISISLMISDVEHLFMGLLAIHISSLEKCLFKSFFHFWIRFFVVVAFQGFSIYPGY